MPKNEYHYSFAIVDHSVGKVMSALTCQLLQKQTWSLYLLATGKWFEKKGFASILIDYLKNKCLELKIERIQLSPLPEQINFYVNWGFKSYAAHNHDITFEVGNHIHGSLPDIVVKVEEWLFWIMLRH